MPLPRLLIWSLALVWLTLLPGTPVAAATPAEELNALIAKAWEFRMQEYPQFATRTGDHRFNDKLASVSLADAERRNQADQGFLDRLAAIDADALAGQDRVNYKLFERELRDGIAEYGFNDHLVAISNRSGFHISFPDLPKLTPLATTKDFENYLARLRAFGDYADGNIALLREGVRTGYTLPAVILEGWEDSVDAHIVDDPTESVLYEPLTNPPATVPAGEHDRLRKAAKSAIAESVVPAYQRFRRFMADEYLPNCRTAIGASALPGGREFYRHRVRKFTTLDTTPEEVHARGLAEVKRIRSEMDAIIERVGFDGDFAAFVEHLRTEPKFYAKTPDELLAKCALILKRADGQLPKVFAVLPRTPYGLVPVPDYIAPKTTSAYYMRPGGDGTTAGNYYLNTYNLPSRPLYALEALSLHEAVPGHHLQLALQQELPDMPPFRKYSGFTAFIEGWALYSERLGLEMGFYEDPHSDFGRLTMEIWRACRLVVDTGVHYFGWTRDEAIAFMAANSAMSLHNIRAEVDRYIGWPGQALAYKTGELKIRELRGMAEERLGDEFDVREFHRVVLGAGAVPLDVLEENVVAWVESAE
ncbi:MAG: DUF885 domain-containing protein [Planctomycetota bacterium]